MVFCQPESSREFIAQTRRTGEESNTDEHSDPTFIIIIGRLSSSKVE